MTSTVGTPVVTATSDGLHFVWTTEGIEVQVARFYESRSGLTCEVTFLSNDPSAAGLLHSAQLNLLSSSGREDAARHLRKRIKNLDWDGLLQQLCYIAKDKYRTGDPSVDLRTVDPFAQTRWLLYPYIEHGGPTVLFAEGGSGKSILALWMGLQVALGPKDSRGRDQPSSPVLYLDYETSSEVHAERMNALYTGMRVELDARPEVYYRRMKASLAQSTDAVRDEIARTRAGLVVIDSLAGAGDGAPEESWTSIALFQAIRALGCPSLCVHHKRKGTGQKEENQRDRAFGSVYYMNFARLAWEMESVTNEADDTTVIGMVNVKVNNGRLLKRHALQLHFENNEEDQLLSLRVTKHDMTEFAELAGKVPIRDRIMAELRRGAMTAQELSETLGVDSTTLKPKLSALNRAGKVISMADHKWGMAATGITDSQVASNLPF